MERDGAGKRWEEELWELVGGWVGNGDGRGFRMEWNVGRCF